MGVDDLPPGGVEYRVGDEPRAAHEMLHHDHRDGREQIRLARSDQARVEKLHEAQTRIGREVPAVEPAQAIDRDRLGLVFFEDGLLRQVKPSRLLQRGVRIIEQDAAGRRLPARGKLPRLVAVRALTRSRQFLKTDLHHADAETLLDLLGQRSAWLPRLSPASFA